MGMHVYGAAQETGQIAAHLHIRGRRRLQAKMRVKARDSMQAVERHVENDGKGLAAPR